MSDDETATAGNPIAAPKAAVSAVDRFTAAHGDAARAVVQPVSRGQVRITLVGADGVLGDVLVRDVATAEAVIAASRAEGAEWDRELAGSVQLAPGHQRRMAGGHAIL